MPDRPIDHVGNNAGADELRRPPAGSYRLVDPPKRVLVHIDGKWWPARLDCWVRETDGWYGRATLNAGGPSNWYAASTLHPIGH